MSLTYWTVLNSARIALSGVGLLAGAEVKIRPEVAFLKDANDTFPLVLVCPRRDQWESVPEGELYMAGDGRGGAMVAYPVLVAILIQNRFDQEQLRFQMDARDEVRKQLWEQRRFHASLPGSPVAWDVGYNPSPRGVDLSALTNPLDVSIQEFLIGTTDFRSNG